jgi:pimeloyl-ACP methyl ester carboxylesterase
VESSLRGGALARSFPPPRRATDCSRFVVVLIISAPWSGLITSAPAWDKGDVACPRFSRRQGQAVRVVVVAAFAAWIAFWAPAAAEASPPASTCQAMRAPVTVPGLSDASVYGELCVPAGGPPPRAVQLLVHGATYTHAYFDWPQERDRYSYVQKALAAGYATFNVDRLGSGQSTHPPSSQVTLSNGAEALHDVISALRSGELGGNAYSRVIWVGHSYGSAYAWIEASAYQDVDAFVLTGLLHSVKPSFLATSTSKLYPASVDPKFASAGLDPGYLTTVPGSRDDLFYSTPNADPSVIALDEELKDTVTTTELQEGTPLFSSPPPDTAPSRAIRVRTLLVIGDRDNIACGQPDGLDCTQTNVTAQESPYYSPQAHMQGGDHPRHRPRHPAAPQRRESRQARPRLARRRAVGGTSAPRVEDQRRRAGLGAGERSSRIRDVESGALA